ncbi:4Fe-4S binding protein [Tissierella sp. Yu-01]|uniref:4Fe-4S binding protein n=1 Tax=Tissierella sp. Yu-01 TaxID=3035694 RepID=UPI00240E518F|nr:4Fe-4S binding protein [Tissierella sp. Yu-01]WFA08904.1 4Fe-4S binding protein [Tissierella sp. Yu-01]
MKKQYYTKTNRVFTPLRKYGWMFTVLVAIGGQWEPKLGLLVVLIMVGLMITSFFSGRYWCGNICPHGSLFDSLIMPISKNKKIPKIFKSKYFIISFLIFFMWNFTRKILNIVPSWGTYDYLDKLGSIFSNTYLMVLIVGGLFAIFINPRTWCQFCPMGSMQKISYLTGEKLGVTKKINKKVTIESKDKCISCGKCEKVCPFQLKPYLEFNANNQFDDINCIKCSTCVVNCPVRILSMEAERSSNYCKFIEQ